MCTVQMGNTNRARRKGTFIRRGDNFDDMSGLRTITKLIAQKRMVIPEDNNVGPIRRELPVLNATKSSSDAT